MSRVHYFQRYSQRENVITNNTLLLFLRLCEYNRFKFEKFIETLFADQAAELPIWGMDFSQQLGTGASVPDGYLAQDSIKIVIETKLGQFGLAQLENHLQAFREEQYKFLVLLGPTCDAIAAPEHAALRKEAKSRAVEVVVATFEQIVRSANDCLSPWEEEMRALVEDYESYCSGENLLPRDKFTVLVGSCTHSLAENLEFKLYYAPSATIFRKTRYLGIYAAWTIQAIGVITNQVACDVDLDAGVVQVLKARGELSEDGKNRIVNACRKARERQRGDIASGHTFYLSDDLANTHLQTKSVIRTFQYFDLERDLHIDMIPATSAELAELLRGRTWS